MRGSLWHKATTTTTLDLLGSSIASGSEIFHAPNMTRIGNDPVSLREANNVAPINGVHDVVVHGAMYDENGAMFQVDNLPTHANQIAEAVSSNPDWNGQPIRLLTCYGGCGPAQEVSDILGVPVQGATGPVGVDQVPNSTPIVKNGQWFTFLPSGGN